MPPRGSAALVGAGLRQALGHDVVVPLPLGHHSAARRDEGATLKGKPETGGLAGVMKTFGSQVSAIGSLVQVLRFGYWSRA